MPEVNTPVKPMKSHDPNEPTRPRRSTLNHPSGEKKAGCQVLQTPVAFILLAAHSSSDWLLHRLALIHPGRDPRIHRRRSHPGGHRRDRSPGSAVWSMHVRETSKCRAAPGRREIDPRDLEKRWWSRSATDLQAARANWKQPSRTLNWPKPRRPPRANQRPAPGRKDDDRQGHRKQRPRRSCASPGIANANHSHQEFDAARPSPIPTPQCYGRRTAGADAVPVAGSH